MKQRRRKIKKSDYKKGLLRGRMASTFFILSTAFLLFSSTTAYAVEPTMAPLNPKFERFMQKGGRVQAAEENSGIPSGQSLGWIPSPLYLPNLKGSMSATTEGGDRVATLSFPATYDLRTLGRVTPVRNQNICGCCWAFSNMGSVESTPTTAEYLDFSEMNLKNTHGFDYGHCDGGNGDMATAYFARWSGPVWEMEDPYDHTSSFSTPGLTEKRHIQHVYLIPEGDSDGIKQAVQTYGGVAIALFFGDFYNESTYAYYFYATQDPNHGGTIVGWDDNFDRNNFTTTPPGDGAWIMKNTWSEYWGESGYYYVSYYDNVLIGEKGYVFLPGDSVSNYDYAYQYDPLGWTSSVGYGIDTGHMANIFTAVSNGKLAAVSFYAPSANSSYTIKIYTGVGSTPTSGTLANTPQSGTLTYAGYHTIDLDALIPISGGQKFSVYVELDSPGSGGFPIAMETPIGGYASGATANAGESFISYAGSSWTDLTSYYSNTNVCIKAFTFKNVQYAMGDLNADSKADIVRYNNELGLDWWDATTATWANLLPFTHNITNIATGDINNDSKDDVIIEIKDAGMYWRDSETGSWTQILESFYPTNDFITADINGDGKDDIVADINGQGFYWRDSETGSWTLVLPSSFTLRRFLAADINGDGKDDIVIDIDGIGIHWRDSQTGTWSLVLEDWLTPLNILALDINNDSKDDLMVAVDSYGLYWRDSDTGAWSLIQTKVFTMASMDAADVDNDGLEDMIGSISGFGLYALNSATAVSDHILYANYATTSIETGDINGDNKDDVFVDIYKVGTFWRDSNTGSWTQILP